ncbi:GDP-mannose mannosyl hydrolase [Haloplanus halophilus]|uniref:GDP-mannose mannosyl hydrolase n=1 Tax=Haloplanus halophilus TaxID=2949993 RepID=UPI00203E3D14|nr:NUDIX domain-containing protein [Haloplanus sp. GDY1]
MTDRPIPDDDWRTIVANVPIPSVDLVVRHDGGVVLGRRENAPARGEWFVPGGRVRKGERLADAVHRIAEAELGVDVRIEDRLGAYEHLYDESEVPDVDSKHYLAVGFVVRPVSDAFAPDAQHSALRLVEPPFPDLHPYVEAYLRDA